MGKGIFKTAVMGGFKREDVLAYIDEMDKRTSEYEKKLHAENLQLKKQTAAVESEKSALEKQLRELADKTQGLFDEKKALEEEKDALQKQFDALHEQDTGREEELDALRHDLLLARQQTETLRGALDKQQEQSALAGETAEKEINEEVVALRQRTEVAEGQVQQLTAQAGEKDQGLAALRKSLDDAQAELARREDDAEALRARVDDLEKQISAMGKSEEQIAKVMIEARVTADKMILDAQRRSRETEAACRERLHVLSASLDAFRGQMGNVRDRLHSYMQTADSMLEGVEEAAQRAGTALEAESREAAATAEDGQAPEDGADETRPQ